MSHSSETGSRQQKRQRTRELSKFIRKLKKTDSSEAQAATNKIDDATKKEMSNIMKEDASLQNTEESDSIMRLLSSNSNNPYASLPVESDDSQNSEELEDKALNTDEPQVSFHSEFEVPKEGDHIAWDKIKISVEDVHDDKKVVTFDEQANAVPNDETVELLNAELLKDFHRTSKKVRFEDSSTVTQLSSIDSSPVMEPHQSSNLAMLIPNTLFVLFVVCVRMSFFAFLIWFSFFTVCFQLSIVGSLSLKQQINKLTKYLSYLFCYFSSLFRNCQLPLFLEFAVHFEQQTHFICTSNNIHSNIKCSIPSHLSNWMYCQFMIYWRRKLPITFNQPISLFIYNRSL